MATKQERQLIHEREWIGAILKDGSLWDDKTVHFGHFHTETNKNLYTLIEKCKNEGTPLDISTWRTLSDREIKRVGGMDYIEGCREMCVRANVDRLKELEREMMTYTIAEKMVQEVKSLSAGDYYDLEKVREIVQLINDSTDGVKKSRMSFAELLKESHEDWMNMPDGMSGIDTGYQALNDALDGWQEKDLIIVGARPSMGKTAITVNFMLQSLLKGHAVTYIPAETGDKSIVKRAVAVLGGLPVNAMRNPAKHLNREQMSIYKNTMQKLATLPAHIEEIHDIREIRQLMRERTRAIKDKKHLLVIDHLAHLRDGRDYASRTIEFESYCNQLKSLAKEHNVSVMLLSQLSRAVEQRDNKRPMMSDLRDSGAIEQIADVIAFLYRENYYLPEDEKNPEDIIEFIISKNRDGGLGTIDFKFHAATNRVMEVKNEKNI